MGKVVLNSDATTIPASKSKRNASIEMLRVISMFAILLTHVVQFGFLRKETALFSTQYFVLNFIDAFTIFAVNVYALISGYLMFNKKRRFARVLELWIEVVIFGLISVVLGKVFGTWDVKSSDFIKAFTPFLDGKYWYFTAYIALAVFMPAFNAIVDKFNFKQSRVLFFFIVGVAFMARVADFFSNEVLGFQTGLGFVWISCMYIVGAMIKKHGFSVVMCEKSRKNTFYLFTFVLSCVLIFLSKVSIAFVTNKLMGNPFADIFFTGYVSPLAIMSAISLFRFVYGSKLSMEGGTFLSKCALFLGPCTFGVYIIHKTDFVGHYMYDFCNNYLGTNILVQVGIALCVAVLVYALCTLIEFIRIKLFKLLKIDKFCALVTAKISDIFAKIIKIK